MGSMMGSEITAAAISNDIGKVRRDPFAMLPFIGYHVADYLSHWFEMKSGTKDKDLPKFYYVNWFRKDDKGDFMWPGYGDNARVLKWIFERSEGMAQGVQTPIGIMPDLTDFDTEGLHIQKETLQQLFEVDKAAWLKEMADLKAYYHELGEKMPQALYDELEKQIARLNA